MQYGLLALGTAKEATGATVIRLTLFTHGSRAAHWADARHGELGSALRPLVQHHRYHFRNHIPRTAHHHGVTDAHVFAPGLVLVVQGGIGYRHAPYKHRRQLGHGGQLAGAPHLHVNVQHGGELLLRGVFMGDSPTRLARDKAQADLQGQAVDLVDHTINIKRQLVALLADTLVIRY